MMWSSTPASLTKTSSTWGSSKQTSPWQIKVYSAKTKWVQPARQVAFKDRHALRLILPKIRQTLIVDVCIEPKLVIRNPCGCIPCVHERCKVFGWHLLIISRGELTHVRWEYISSLRTTGLCFQILFQLCKLIFRAMFPKQLQPKQPDPPTAALWMTMTNDYNEEHAA